MAALLSLPFWSLGLSDQGFHMGVMDGCHHFLSDVFATPLSSFLL
jgi:hypothetical protein